MKDVLLFNAGNQLFIIDGSRRTDNAARAVISALWAAGRITIDIADRAKEDRPTLDKIKKNLIHCTMETNDARWKFYTKSGLYMNIPAFCANHITADANGRLYSAEAPTGEETPEPVQTTTTTENEPENGTQAAKTTDMETFKKEYSRIYSHLYEHEGQPGVDATRRKYSRLFDESWEDIKYIVKAFCQKSGDLLTSDRQCAAFMKALETVGTPQDAQQGTESTTGEETPTDDTKTPCSATDKAITDGKTITTDATTPASDPRQQDGKTITGWSTPNGNEITTTTGRNTITGSRTDGGKNITPPRHACENAPGRTERAQAVPTTTQPHKRPPRGKTQDRHTTTGSRGHPGKSYFFRPDAKNGSDPPKI